MKKLTLTVAVTTVIGLLVLASPALAQTLVTSFAPSLPTTPGVWFESDVRFGGTASIVNLTGVGGNLETAQPLPIGAAKLTTGLVNFPDKAEVGVRNSYGMPDDIFSTLSITYSYHKATNAGQNLAAAPSLKLTFSNPVCDDPASTRGPGGVIDCFATLVYEPTWNGPGSTSASPASTNPATDVWTAVAIDENTGLFWTTGGFGFANTAGGPPIKTLAEWRTALSSDFGDATLFQVNVGVGSFNNGQIGYFDHVAISHTFGAGFSESYDFDPTPQHYSAYDVKPEAVIGGGGKKKNELNIDVELDDQFGASLLTVKKAKLLLVPVDKNGEGFVDEVTHLVCYELKNPAGGKGTGVEPKVDVAVVNQFNDAVGDQVMEVKKLKMLCVPSTKAVLP